MITLKSIVLLSLIKLAYASCNGAYYQCGGLNYSGNKCCISGYTCKYINDRFSHCVPNNSTNENSNNNVPLKNINYSKSNKLFVYLIIIFVTIQIITTFVAVSLLFKKIPKINNRMDNYSKEESHNLKYSQMLI
eukprot:jgi/Orpsp1_1/1191061/evm.model.d7180000083234.1